MRRKATFGLMAHWSVSKKLTAIDCLLNEEPGLGRGEWKEAVVGGISVGRRQDSEEKKKIKKIKKIVERNGRLTGTESGPSTTTARPWIS